jgi:hypothetical protein
VHDEADLRVILRPERLDGDRMQGARFGPRIDFGFDRGKREPRKRGPFFPAQDERLISHAERTSSKIAKGGMGYSALSVSSIPR